jgi:hypothetical protein
MIFLKHNHGTEQDSNESIYQISVPRSFGFSLSGAAGATTGTGTIA